MNEEKKEEFLTRKELKILGLKPLEDLAKDGETKNYLFRTTSGTTGGLPMLIARKRKKSSTEKIGFYSGIKRVVGFFGTYNARLGHVASAIYRKEHPAVLFFDHSDLKPKSFNRIFKGFKPDGICGFPSFIIKGLELVQNSKALLGVKKVNMTGEYLSPAKQEFLQKKLPNAKLAIFYAAGEIGFISDFCPNLPLGQYHPKEGTKIEIINQDKDGIGELIVSTELSPSVPIKRYRVGDIGKFVKIGEKCACGDSVTFEVLGRKDFDYIKISGALLMQQEFERVMKELKEYVVDFCGTVQERKVGIGFKGEIKLDIVSTPELKNHQYPEQFISEQIAKKLFVTPTKTLDVLIKNETFLPLLVNLVSNIPIGYKDVKLKKIV